MSFVCQECGWRFKSARAAERAAFGDDGCPGCGSSDIDLNPSPLAVTLKRETITPTKAAALLARPGEGIEEAMKRVEREVRSELTRDSLHPEGF